MVRIKSGFVRDGVIVIEHPSANTPDSPRSLGGQIVMRTSGSKRSRKALLSSTRSVKTGLETNAVESAKILEARLRTALEAEYSKTGTGRFARGIRVTATSSEVNGKIQTSLQVKAVIYRETKFLTNLGGKGYFSTFPVGPYRIFARGVKSALGQQEQTMSFGRPGDRALAKFLRREGSGRLKVPNINGGAFFIGGRSGTPERSGGRGGLRTQRGGGESRFITLGGNPKRPNIAGTTAAGRPYTRPGDLQSNFFVYPMWVNHPGFRRDLLSELVLAAGGSYQEGTISVVKEQVSKVNIQRGPRERIKQKGLVASGSISTGASLGEVDSTVPIYFIGRR